MIQKPTNKMALAVKTIARKREDWHYTFWSTLSQMSFQEASDYINKYGRKVRING